MASMKELEEIDRKIRLLMNTKGLSRLDAIAKIEMERMSNSRRGKKSYSSAYEKTYKNMSFGQLMTLDINTLTQIERSASHHYNVKLQEEVEIVKNIKIREAEEIRRKEKEKKDQDHTEHIESVIVKKEKKIGKKI